MENLESRPPGLSGLTEGLRLLEEGQSLPPLGNFEQEMKEMNYDLRDETLDLDLDQKGKFLPWDYQTLQPLEDDSQGRENYEEHMTGILLNGELSETCQKENFDPQAGSLEPVSVSKSSTSLSASKADEEFIYWLKEKRETKEALHVNQVKDKVEELIETIGRAEVESRSKWFLQWHDRREERSINSVEEDNLTSMRRKETQNLAYPPAFKLEVAWYARQYSQYAAAKIFGVARRRIFDWMRQIPKLEDLMAKGHMKKMTGRGPKNRDIDQALYDWYCLRKASGARPKSCHVQKKAREIYLANGYLDMKCSYGWFKRWSQRFQIQLRNSYDDQLIEWILIKFDNNISVNNSGLQSKSLNIVHKEDPSFKASAGWASRFCRRHREFLDPDQGGLKSLPDHLEERVSKFILVLHPLLKEKGTLRDSIGCVDELPLHFPLGSDLKKKDASMLKASGMKEAQLNVILSTVADGTLLPPMIVIRGDGKTSSHHRLATLSTSGIIILIKEDDACITDQVLKQWLTSLWFKGSRSGGHSVLIADSFSSHTSKDFQEAFSSREGGCLAIIPPACSSSLQPLHRGLKLRFRREMESLYRDFVEKNQRNGLGYCRIESLRIVKWIQDIYLNIIHEKDWIASSFEETQILPRH